METLWLEVAGPTLELSTKRAAANLLLEALK